MGRYEKSRCFLGLTALPGRARQRPTCQLGQVLEVGGLGDRGCCIVGLVVQPRFRSFA